MNDPKPLLRNEMKRRRAGLATSDPLAGDRLAEMTVAAMDAGRSWPQAGQVIAGYYPIQSEINPFPLLQAFQARGYGLSLPCLINGPDGHRMIFRRFAIGDTLVLGPFDIRQPADTAQELDPDVILLPLLAFDGNRRRLGYGGGYYDRALEKLREAGPVRAIGIAFSGQAVAQVPFEVHDQPLDEIFTELGLAGAGPQD